MSGWKKKLKLVLYNNLSPGFPIFLPSFQGPLEFLLVIFIELTIMF